MSLLLTFDDPVQPYIEKNDLLDLLNWIMDIGSTCSVWVHSVLHIYVVSLQYFCVNQMYFQKVMCT